MPKSRPKRIDRDVIPLFLIGACLAIWLSSRPWLAPDAVAIAGDIIKVSFGGVIGYMVRTVIDTVDSALSSNRYPTDTQPPMSDQQAQIDNLVAENQRLIDEINALREGTF
jgi:hypothetical protein